MLCRKFEKKFNLTHSIWIFQLLFHWSLYILFISRSLYYFQKRSSNLLVLDDYEYTSFDTHWYCIEYIFLHDALNSFNFNIWRETIFNCASSTHSLFVILFGLNSFQVKTTHLNFHSFYSSLLVFRWTEHHDEQSINTVLISFAWWCAANTFVLLATFYSFDFAPRTWPTRFIVFITWKLLLLELLCTHTNGEKIEFNMSSFTTASFQK